MGEIMHEQRNRLEEARSMVARRITRMEAECAQLEHLVRGFDTGAAVELETLRLVLLGCRDQQIVLQERLQELDALLELQREMQDMPEIYGPPSFWERR